MVIERTYFPEQTLGELYINDKFKCKTLELPYLGNKPWVSCIPEGVYTCTVLQSSNKFKYQHILINNVPRRTDIKIHKGNFKSDITGCILVGASFLDINNDDLVDVTYSKDTLNKIMFLVDDEFKLWIKSK